MSFLSVPDSKHRYSPSLKPRSHAVPYDAFNCIFGTSCCWDTFCLLQTEAINPQLFIIELSLNWCHRKEFSTLRHLMLNFIEGITRFVLLGIWIYSYTPSVWRSKIWSHFGKQINFLISSYGFGLVKCSIVEFSCSSSYSLSTLQLSRLGVLLLTVTFIC